MLLPTCDRIVDRDALLQGCRSIGKPPEEEQRCPQRPPGEGTAERHPLRVCENHQALGEIVSPLQLAAHIVIAP
jgi:hypothetical protein